MSNRSKQWAQEYSSIFQDESVVAAYEHRPVYPPETFTVLESLIPSTATGRTVLDAGCGTGFIARRFAPCVDHIDAVDISERMIAVAQTLPGGTQQNIRWLAAPIETAPLNGPYALIVAAASLHWMDWDVVLPRFAAQLSADGILALVETQPLPDPWEIDIRPILQHYSMNKDFSAYDISTVAAELEQRRLFRKTGNHETPPVRFQQPVDSWVESFHARNGFSRDRMDPQQASDCDARLRAAILPYCPEGIVERYITARILWGIPGSAFAREPDILVDNLMSRRINSAG